MSKLFQPIRQYEVYLVNRFGDRLLGSRLRGNQIDNAPEGALPSKPRVRST